MARSNTVIGLDVGKFAVKAVWAEIRRGTPTIMRAEVLRLPQGSTPTSVIVPWVEKLGIGKCRCVVSLPGQLAMFQPFLLPPGDPRTPEQAAGMEVIKFNEMAVENMIYGFAPFSINEGERRLLLAMARPSVLDETLEFAREIGLNTIDVVPAPVALFNAAESQMDEHSAPYMFVDMGHSSTDIAVGPSSGLMFARAFSGGGQLFTDNLARTRNMSGGQAESLKIEKGRVGAGGDGVDLTETADMWLSEIQSCLSVYQSVFTERKAKISRIVLAGGSAALEGLPEYMTEKLGIETTRLQTLPSRQELKDPASFAVAIGLAMAGLEKETTSISLLPPDVRDELGFRRQKPFWIAAGATAAAILAVCLACGFRQNQRMQEHLRKQDAKLKELQLLRDQIKATQANSAQIRAMSAPLKELLRAGPLARDLTSLVLDATAPGDWITMICDSTFYFTLPRGSLAPPAEDKRLGMRDARKRKRKQKSDKPNEEDEGFRRLIIEGYTPTPNLITVKELILKLKSTEYVEDADIMADTLIPDEGEIRGKRRNPNAKRFVVDVKVAAP